jgi:Excreted virulence factor EspC, type VII ESX diderm
MSGGFHVVTDELRSYAEYMRGMVGDLDAIDGYAREQAGNTTGFTGMLAVLQPVIQGVSNLFGETLDIGKDRLAATAKGLDDSAAYYETVDRNEAANADRLARQVPEVS